VTDELSNLRIVLVETRNPLNIGAVARAMSNFGAFDLRLVQPYDPSYRVAKSAVGAARVMKDSRVYDTVAEAVADCTLVIGTTAVGNRELVHPLHVLDQAAKKIRKELRSGRVALLFGSEKHGLTNDSLSHCHWLLRIPTRTEHRSMNLAQSVVVCLYELARSLASKPRSTKKALANMETVDRIAAALLESLHASEYIPPRGSASAEEKLRRMLRRFQFNENDAKVLLGMLRKIAWKLDSKD